MRVTTIQAAGVFLMRGGLLVPLLAASVASANPPPLTLESIFTGSDFRGESMGDIRWQADGSAYRFSRPDPGSGTANLYQHDIESGQQELLIAGQALSHESKPIGASAYQWVDDGRYLLVRGPVTRTWDSVYEAPHYVYDFKGKTLTALGPAGTALRNVYLSPAGTHAGYVLDNNLYIVDLRNGETHTVTEDGSANIFNGILDYGSTMFGINEGWHWSPDGRKVAFWRLDVTDVKVFYMIDELGKYNTIHPLKYPNTGEAHAVYRIGVHDLHDGKTTWMEIGDNPDDYIPQMGWTPGSDTLAIQRLTRDHERLDLLLADVGTGASRIVLTDTDSAWIDITRDLMFLSDGKQFVWTSEKSGYRHAYLYDLEGNGQALTSGDWEIVSLIAADEANGWLYFYAKKDSFIDQHVYRVALQGSQVEKLSGEPGWYEWALSPGGRHTIETYSSASTPPIFRLREPESGDAMVLAKSDPEGLKKFWVPNPEFFQFTTADGAVLNAYMIKPVDFDASKRYPVIAYGYGNAGSQMVVNRWGSARGAQRDLWHRYMAGQGFLVFCMDNRTTAGRGKKAKNTTYGEYGKWAIHDQIEGVGYLKTLPYVDPERLGFWGWSGGGYLAAALMTKGAPHYNVGVSVAPVIDLTRYQAVGVERWMDSYEDNPEGYHAVNLINFADRLEGDLLLIHGTGDENVKFAFTLQFADALIAAGKQFDMMVYPNEHHGIEGARQHVYTKISNYFKDRL